MALIYYFLGVVSKIFNQSSSRYNFIFDPASSMAISKQSLLYISTRQITLLVSGFFLFTFFAYFYTILQSSSLMVAKTRQKQRFRKMKCACLASYFTPDYVIFLQVYYRLAVQRVCFQKQILSWILRGSTNLSTTTIATSLYSFRSSSQASFVCSFNQLSLHS